MIKEYVEEISNSNRLIVNITNYVTVNDVANMILSVNASPIMSDEEEEIEELIKMCDVLIINIGTLNLRTIKLMKVAAIKATEYNKPIILDPVGAGATKLRTKVALDLLVNSNISLVRGNASEIMALYGLQNSSHGVDVSLDDLNKDHSKLGRLFAKRFDCICVISGPIDYICNDDECYKVYEGVARMSKITGTGCMLSAYLAVYYKLNTPIDMIAKLVAYYGNSAVRIFDDSDGIATFKRNFYDEISKINNYDNWQDLKYEKI